MESEVTKQKLTRAGKMGRQRASKCKRQRESENDGQRIGKGLSRSDRVRSGGR